MKLQIRNTVLILTLMLFYPFIHADEYDALDQWVQQTLTNTLTVNYTQQDSDFTEIRTNYTADAWNGIESFLSGYVNDVRQNQLAIHPVMQGDPVIIATGIYSGMHYWKINQTAFLPEVNTRIAVSLVVLSRNVTSSNQVPFIIQSVDMQRIPPQL